MLIGTVALMVLGVQPILFGALVEDGRLTESTLGLVATLETLALALGAVVGPWLLNRGGIRLKTVALAVLLAALNLAVFWARTPLQVCILRAAAGFAEGMLLGAAIIILTFTRHPERMNALFLALSTIPQVFAAYLLPVTLMPKFGSNAGFGLMAVLAVLAVPAALALPDRPPKGPAEPTRDDAGSARVWTVWTIIALIAITLENAAIGAAWNYLEQMASEAHLAPSVVGTAVAGTLTFQVLGSFAVAWVGWKLDYRLALVGGCLLLAVDSLLLGAVHTSGAFITLACLFGLLWLALAPFAVKLAIALDPSRRIAMMITPLVLVGLSLGPLVASAVVTHADVTGAYRMSSATAVVSAVLFVLTVIAARARKAVATAAV